MRRLYKPIHKSKRLGISAAEKVGEPKKHKKRKKRKKKKGKGQKKGKE